MTITNKDKQREAEREVAQRRRVYPRLIDNGKMTKEQATRQIAIMVEIAGDYAVRAEEDEKATRLI